MNTIISANNLGKEYKLGQKRSTSLRESIYGITRNLKKEKSFWALKDVNFEIKQGEKVGIIGRNGAGKSTLLKILSRITYPTTGEIKVYGDLASLLEVGTGFHPELTGRENIFLNGAILGMKRNQIKSRFEEIVEFAGVEEFLDTPVKHYSSGMYVRLAFSVAAHLDQEILVIDEVLAVGDAQFQRKCLGKMQDISDHDGRTILFVSHQMNSISKLCNRAFFVQQGELVDFGSRVEDCISEYFGDSVENFQSNWIAQSAEDGDFGVLSIKRFSVVSADLNPISVPQDNSRPVYVLIDVDIKEFSPDIELGISVKNEANETIFRSFHYDQEIEKWPKLSNGLNQLKVEIPPRMLNEGNYRIELISGLRRIKWFSGPGASTVAIGLTIKGGLSESPIWHERREGILAPVLNWINQE
jgi:lipopolysaccharide transport system ATP-binding protein